MYTMSKAMSAAQVESYYEQEYVADMGIERDQAAPSGRWAGQLAEEWGLSGPVDRETFDRLCEGLHPETGEELVAHVKEKTYLNAFGEEVTSLAHRAAFDATVSAPKSVSLAALVGGDERVLQAHRESVDASLKVFEEFTQARFGGHTPAETTGKFIAAQFEHAFARPDAAGYAAPQLHTHVVIMNMTETATGQVRPLQPIELYRSQRLATAVYRAELADRLRGLGYELVIDRKTGAPEIKGFSREHLAAQSPRSAEVRRGAEDLKLRLEREGATVSDGAGLRQAAARRDRVGKDFDVDEMRRHAGELDARFGHESRRVVAEALERGGLDLSPEEKVRRAREAVTFARDHSLEREAVVDRRSMLTEALRRGQGMTDFESVSRELAAREESGEFVGVYREGKGHRVTTDRTLRMERDNIDIVRRGRDAVEPLLDPATSARKLDAVADRYALNAGQREALRDLATFSDRIVGLQGGAGTGKTTALRAFHELAKGGGFEVQGLAPTTRAAQSLAESGIPSGTLQKFLAARTGEATGARLFVLDESSLAGTRALNRFFAKLRPEDRVLFVGDVRQHQAVEAGSPFELFQRNGLRTARLAEIVRQRDPRLKSVVENLAERRTGEAMKMLREDGRIVEIVDPAKRHAAVAAEYCRAPEDTLVVSPGNKERRELNRLIHERLQTESRIAKDSRTLRVLLPRQEMTGAEREVAASYKPGEDVIRFNRASRVFDVQAGDYARVTEVNGRENLLTVERTNGETLTYNPTRLSGVSVYREEEREFSVGERLQFRAPQSEMRVANGEFGTLARLDDNTLGIKLDEGRYLKLDAAGPLHLDYGYAVTSFSSQGTTVGRVLVEIDASKSAQLVNDRLGYVAVSRARDEAVVFTNDADRLEKSLDRSLSKENAVDAFGMTRDVSAGKGIESAVVAQVEQAAEAELAEASLERTVISVGIALV
jgi:conjugative relaxase-like TrwC/TraI family protein